MTDKKTTPTDEDRRLARKWAASIFNTPDASLPMETAAARVILHAVPAPSRPTLADMTPEERAACRWMQCDVEGEDARAVIFDPCREDGGASVLWPGGFIEQIGWGVVTPRPDLARMEWTGNKKPAPALPDGWKLADHPDHGRVIVTTKNLVRDGYMGFIHRADPINAGHGSDWCKPDELTYLDTPEAVPPNTLAVGSVWVGVDALTRACEESGRDQIVVSDFGGYVSVWSHDAEWWEGSAPPRTTPYTIIHTGKEADQ